MEAKQLKQEEFSEARLKALEERAFAEAKRVSEEPEMKKSSKRINYVCKKCNSHKSKNPTVYKIVKPGCEHNWKEE